MPPDKAFRKAELAPQIAHLVLEQLAQRLDKAERHLFRQTTDIVMRLDRHRIAAGGRNAFNDIGIEGALRQKGRALDLLCLFLEDFDETGADDFALLLRVGHAVQLPEEQVRGVAVDQRNVVMPAEQRHHLFRLAGP